MLLVLNQMLSSITTDNCSAILGAGDRFKNSAEFPVLSVHIGCLGHQISLITNSVISEFAEAFNSIPDSDLEGLVSSDCTDYDALPNECEESYMGNHQRNLNTVTGTDSQDNLTENFLIPPIPIWMRRKRYRIVLDCHAIALIIIRK